MDMEKVAVFRMTTGRMQWLAERQRLLSQNVANSDTPKYQPRDLADVDFRKLVERQSQMRVERTHANHVTLGGEINRFRAEDSGKPYETAPDGNAVVLEEQLIKTAQTTHDYELMTNLYHKHMMMFRTALGRGGNQ